MIRLIEDDIEVRLDINSLSLNNNKGNADWKIKYNSGIRYKI